MSDTQPAGLCCTRCTSGWAMLSDCPFEMHGFDMTMDVERHVMRNTWAPHGPAGRTGI
jgi:hypothetical protein